MSWMSTERKGGARPPVVTESDGGDVVRTGHTAFGHPVVRSGFDHPLLARRAF